MRWIPLDPSRGDEVMPLTEMAADNPPPDEEAVDHEQRLLLEVALRRLNPVEAWVIRERYGLCTLILDELRWPESKPLADSREDAEGTSDPGVDWPSSSLLPSQLYGSRSRLRIEPLPYPAG